MSSYFDSASLVMIPSGYKTSKVYSVKPTDGTGDLTFTRSNDTATRVASNGLIEKVRTNLVLQSQAFDTADWAKAAISVTANSVANPLDAVVNADTIVGTAGTTQKYIGAANTFNGLFTFSVYAKYVSQQFVQIFVGSDASPYANFDIQNGAVSASGSTASIVSVGSGWYRLSITFTSSTGVGIYLLNVDSLAALRFSTTSTTNSYYAFGAQVETGDIATDYIATTTAAVSVGPVANVPRLDYLNSSCPRLLLEPQRTNLFTYSEQLDNAAWTKYNLGVTANATISPDGYQNADKIFCNITGSAVPLIHQSPSYTNTTSTVSGYFKKAEYNFVVIHAFGIAGTVFNINTGTIVSGTGSITSVGNGWYRCVAILNIGSDSQTFFTPSIDGSVGYTGTSGSGVYAWGCQAEASVSYATSYIPTLGSASTRGSEAASKTGISSLIGQTEGTLFCEVSFKTNDAGTYLAIEDWGNLELVRIYSDAGPLNAQIFNGGNVFLSQTSYNAVVGQSYKMAIGYSTSGASFYVNGVLVSQATASYSIPTCANVRLAAFTSGQEMNADIKQALLFPTRLSNADLAALTA